MSAATIQFLRGRVEYHKLQAEWWMLSASTGTTTRRKITDGNGELIQPQLLTYDALENAQKHISNMDDYSERLFEAIRSEEDDRTRRTDSRKDNG